MRVGDSLSGSAAPQSEFPVKQEGSNVPASPTAMSMPPSVGQTMRANLWKVPPAHRSAFALSNER